nr:hypothetical protein BaRGS_023555 [Batillaria attramentaria]
MLNQENLSKQFEAILGQWHKMEKDWETTKSDLEREKEALQIEKEHWKRAAELLKEQLVNQFEATVKKSKGTQEDIVGDDKLSMLDPTAWEKWRSLHRANIENSRASPENSRASPESTWFKSENSGLSKLEQLPEEMVPPVVDVNMVAEHEVASRSDDVSPLETVVTQHSHRLGVLDAEIQALKNADQALENAQGSVYTHWGHSTCPSTSHLVYSGVVGGSYYTADNAAPNYLCLPLNPVLSSHSIPSRFAELYGAEYETYDSHDDSDPVCAVCRSQRPTTVMIPATNVCSAGWTLEYSGYLMANSRGFNAGYEETD